MTATAFFGRFIFSYLEHLAESGDMKERRRMVTRLSNIKDVLLGAGYDELVLEGPLELLLDLLESDALTVESWRSSFGRTTYPTISSSAENYCKRRGEGAVGVLRAVHRGHGRDGGG